MHNHSSNLHFLGDLQKQQLLVDFLVGRILDRVQPQEEVYLELPKANNSKTHPYLEALLNKNRNNRLMVSLAPQLLRQTPTHKILYLEEIKPVQVEVYLVEILKQLNLVLDFLEVIPNKLRQVLAV